ncbi:MAG: hypothetical protein KC656_12880, partial [Myxococcales bacterium]|nr:hypothetical protein [Myxococcales bacterium]
TAPVGAALHMVPMVDGAQGSFAFFGVDLDQPQACALNVDVSGPVPAAIAFTGMMVVGDDAICLDNATATLDGQPYVPTGSP